MTVAANLNRITYNGNGSTTVFAYTFPIFDEDNLKVYLVNTSTDVATLQTITTHYTVSGVGNDSGGNVTMLIAPASGYQLLIIREVPIVQESEYNDNREIPADTLEEDLDKLVMIAQQHDETLERSVTLPIQVSGVSAELPVPEEDTILGWNSAGTALENKTPGDLSSAFDITLSVADTKKLVRVNTAGDGYELIAGTAYDQIFAMSSKIMKWAKGADVASASALTLGDDGNFFDITGTTSITSITAKSAGTVVLLQFDGILTVTDGSNLKLAGNFTTASESTMVLVCDGTNWYEISRSPVTSTEVYPKFLVDRNGSNQTISDSTYTKVQFDTERFDTNNNFDSSTNYRFTPTSAGKYILVFNGGLLSVGSGKSFQAAIYKNGSLIRFTQVTNYSGSTGSLYADITAIEDANGSTDYFEAYVYHDNGSSLSLNGNTGITFFTGSRLI